MEKSLYRIVIVEDNQDFASTLEDLINSSDEYYVVGVYFNGEDAIKNQIKDKADIVLMDIELPGMNGIDCTYILRKKNDLIKILMITVFENSNVVFDALCAGAVGYLTKNVTRKIILNSLGDAVMGGLL